MFAWARLVLALLGVSSAIGQEKPSVCPRAKTMAYAAETRRARFKLLGVVPPIHGSRATLTSSASARTLLLVSLLQQFSIVQVTYVSCLTHSN